MDFIEYANNWAKSEVTQARIMISIGILLLVSFIGIIKNQNELLRGTLIPLGLLLAVLIGYGGYILYSRPAHVKQSISFYQQSKKEAIAKEQIKHLNDNKAGKMLIKYVYPSLLILSVIALILLRITYYKGLALGFSLLFISTYIIDYGFVSRSDAFLSFLSTL